MKKKLFYKSLILFPVLVLSACGYGLKEIYSDDYYNSSNFLMNYYDTWNQKIDPNNPNNLVKEGHTIVMDSEDYFTRYDDPLFTNIEEQYDDLTYDESDYGSKYDVDVNYGQHYKLSSIESDFKYGVISKLYDGQIFCYGDTTKARLQIAPKKESTLPGYNVESNHNSGFGQLFPKQYAGGSSYLAFDFKAYIEINKAMIEFLGVDNASQVNNLDDCIWDITLYLGLYVKQDKEYVKHTVVMDAEDVSSNGGTSGHHLKSVDVYSLVGFPLSKLKYNDETVDLTGLAGISIEYTLNSVTYKGSYPPLIDDDELMVKTMNDLNLHHALWLYEFLMPNSTWR